MCSARSLKRAVLVVTGHSVSSEYNPVIEKPYDSIAQSGELTSAEVIAKIRFEGPDNEVHHVLDCWMQVGVLLQRGGSDRMAV